MPTDLAVPIAKPLPAIPDKYGNLDYPGSDFDTDVYDNATEVYTAPNYPSPAYPSPSYPDSYGSYGGTRYEIDAYEGPGYEVENYSGPDVLPAPLDTPIPDQLPMPKHARLRATRGMRGALNKVGFRLSLSAGEQRELERRERIRRQLTDFYQVAVVSVKGGVGRTTIAATLGSVFATIRSDRVMAMDANPHFGDLSNRVARNRYGLTLRDLVHAPDSHIFSQVLGYTVTNAADLSVLASPWRTEADEPLTGPETADAINILRRHFNLGITDCGPGLLDPPTMNVLQNADAVLVVTSTTFGGVNGAVATFNWLHAHGFQHLINKAVVAITHHQQVKPEIDVDAVADVFEIVHRPTFRLPYDPHLAEGGMIDLRLLEKRTLLAFEELAAGLADEFAAYPGEPR